MTVTRAYLSNLELDERVAAIGERARAVGKARPASPVVVRHVAPTPAADRRPRLPERTVRAIAAFREQLLDAVHAAGEDGITCAHLTQALRSNSQRVRNTADYFTFKGIIVQHGRRPGPGERGVHSRVLYAAEHAPEEARDA